MERLDLLITASRQDTDNEDFDETTGIPDAAFIRWANRAQERIQARILKQKPSVFQKEKVTQCVASQESYSTPADLFLGTRIEALYYTPSGQDADYYELDLKGEHERLTGQSNHPAFYIRRSAQLLLQPKPPTSVAKIRYTYQQTLPKLDVRRGTISAITLSATELTAFTLDPTTLTEDNATEITNKQYLSIVDKDGNIKMANVAVTSIDLTTGVVTLDGNHTLDTSETGAVGQYVVAGKFATTHSALNDNCERYLSAYMDWKAQRKDSSNDATESNGELKAIEDDIVESYAEAEANVLGVPIINTEYLAPG